jgi:hypothetical protein
MTYYLIHSFIHSCCQHDPFIIATFQLPLAPICGHSNVLESWQQLLLLIAPVNLFLLYRCSIQSLDHHSPGTTSSYRQLVIQLFTNFPTFPDCEPLQRTFIFFYNDRWSCNLFCNRSGTNIVCQIDIAVVSKITSDRQSRLSWQSRNSRATARSGNSVLLMISTKRFISKKFPHGTRTSATWRSRRRKKSTAARTSTFYLPVDTILTLSRD